LKAAAVSSPAVERPSAPQAKLTLADVRIQDFRGSGLIVTTSSFSKGAREVCLARNYPIREANRETVAKWVKGLRTPNTGVFLGE
jgi:restriction system protein